MRKYSVYVVGNGKKVMWTTLHHHGVLFPPEYTPHGVKMLYDNKAVDLTPALVYNYQISITVRHRLKYGHV